MRGGRTAGVDSWLILVTAVAVGWSVVLQTPSWLRIPLLLSFLLICPGLAMVRLFELGSGSAQLALAWGLSISLDILVPTALIYARLWSPGAALSALAAIAVVGAAVVLIRQMVRNSLLLETRRVEHVTATGGLRPATPAARVPEGGRVTSPSRDAKPVAAPPSSVRNKMLDIGRTALSGRDLTVRLMTIVILAAWSYPLLLLVDRPVDASIALGIGLVAGMVLRSTRRIPVALAGPVLALVALAAIAERSFDLRDSFTVAVGLQVVNVWGPGVMGASLGLVAKPIADQVNARVKRSTPPLRSAAKVSRRRKSGSTSRSTSDDDEMAEPAPPAGQTLNAGRARHTVSGRWDGSMRVG